MLPEIKKIVYATDLREGGSKNAFKMAVAMAKAHGAQLCVLHVMDPISHSMENMLRGAMAEGLYDQLHERTVEGLKAELMQRIDALCQEEVADVASAYPGGLPVAVVEQGAPDKVILKVASEWQADMVVMGTRVHTGIGQVVLGSTANKVIHHSRVPVLVYPL